MPRKPAHNIAPEDLFGKPPMDLASILDAPPEKPAKRAKKAADPVAPAPVPPQDSPKTRVSFYGNTYPNSVEVEWTEYKGCGWVHNDERVAFRRNYGECNVSKKWFYTDNLQADSLGHWICPNEAEKAGWFQCGFSTRWIDPSDVIDIKNGNDRTGRLYHCSRRQLDDNGGPDKCDLSGKLFMPKTLKRVLRSEKYKQVAYCMIKPDSPVALCQHCGNVYESDQVRVRKGEGVDGKRLCQKCYVGIVKKNVILSWSDHMYPDPIYSMRKNLGYRVVDGLIYATGEPQVKKVIRLFGVEAETEVHVPGMQKQGLDRFDMAVNLKEALGEDFVVCKEDGSLVMNGKYSGVEKYAMNGDGLTYAGFEIVSAPASLDIHRERWYKIQDAVGYKQLRAWDTDTCGLHVHVSREALTSLQIARVIAFVNHPYNQPLIQKVAGRKSSEYYKYKEVPYGQVLQSIPRSDETRRWAINLTNPATVEFRIFRGTINPRHIIRDIEFCDAICDFCQPALYSIKDMCDYHHFVAFVDRNRKHWPLLAEWFVRHEFIKAPAITERVQIERMTLHADKIEEVEPERVEAPMRVITP